MNKLMIATGFIILILHSLGWMPFAVQVYLFIAGIVLVGVPHGAADLLVGLQNAREEKRLETRISFLARYLLKLLVFGSCFYFFPTLSLVLFLCFSSFHFGETDLHRFDTHSMSGKAFALAYGMLVIGFIVLLHIEEAKPLLLALGVPERDMFMVDWLRQQQVFLLSVLLILFFSTVFVHFLRNPAEAKQQESFLLQLAALFFLLYHLPLLLGFFFYFVIWHSLLSLRNIFLYLRTSGGAGNRKIFFTMAAYSILTFVGMGLFSFFLGESLSQQAMITLAFAALAVLTAPHMLVMHGMYQHLRKRLFQVYGSSKQPGFQNR